MAKSPKKNESIGSQLGQPPEPSVDIHEVAARLFVRGLGAGKTPEHVAEQAFKDAATFIEESKKH